MKDVSYIYAQIKLTQVCFELEREGFSTGSLVKAQINKESKTAIFPANSKVSGFAPNDCLAYPGNYEIIKKLNPTIKKTKTITKK